MPKKTYALGLMNSRAEKIVKYSRRICGISPHAGMFGRSETLADMGSPDPTMRIRAQYGSILEAMRWCAEDLKLGVYATSRQLGVDVRIVRRWRIRTGVQFLPKKELNPLCRAVGIDRSEQNAKLGERRKGSRRSSGMIWYQGEPTWHYLKDKEKVR